MRERTSGTYRAPRVIPMLAALLFTNVGVTNAQSDWSVQNLGAPINTAAQEGFPTITESGLVLYFARRTVGVVDREEIESWDIWVSERSGLDEQWGEPRRLPDHINTIDDFAQAIIDDREPAAPGQEGVKGLELAAAIIYSGCTGERATFPLDREKYDNLLSELRAGRRLPS